MVQGIVCHEMNKKKGCIQLLASTYCLHVFTVQWDTLSHSPLPRYYSLRFQFHSSKWFIQHQHRSGPAFLPLRIPQKQPSYLILYSRHYGVLGWEFRQESCGQLWIETSAMTTGRRTSLEWKAMADFGCELESRQGSWWDYWPWGGARCREFGGTSTTGIWRMSYLQERS